MGCYHENEVIHEYEHVVVVMKRARASQMDEHVWEAFSTISYTIN